MHAVLLYPTCFSSYYKYICSRGKFFMVKHSYAGIEFNACHVPVYKENIKQRDAEKLIVYLKSNQVTHVLLTQDFLNQTKFCQMMQENFLMPEGIQIIKHKIFDIIRKCAVQKGIEIQASTVALMTDSPKEAEEYIMRLYRHVRKIRIITKSADAFAILQNRFMEEYGLFISCDEEIALKNEITISLNIIKTESDFNVSRQNLFDNQLQFRMKYGDKELFPHAPLCEDAIAFLMLQKGLIPTEESIRRFFKEHYVKITKIKNND